MMAQLDGGGDRVDGLFWLIGTAALFVLVASGLASWYAWPWNKSLGDMGQALSALFGGLAFVGVVAAILLQRQELRLQRYELEQTREVLREQRAQLEAQDKTMRRQSFEATYFALVKRFREVAESVVTLAGAPRPAVVAWLELMHHLVAQNPERFSKLDPDAQLERYTQFLAGHSHILASYFAILAETLEFLKTSDFSGVPIYSRILRAQLSPNERVILALHGLIEEEKHRLRPLIERFGLLARMPAWPGYPALHLEKAYKPAAFADPQPQG